MPTYEYKCNSCQACFEQVLKISEMDEPTKNNCPQCSQKTIERLFPSGAPSLGDPYVLGVTKKDGALRERLQEIKRNHPGSKINV
jgi:putative FmdB family regulatory protein